MSKKIFNFNQVIQHIITKEKLELLVISYGGSASNLLTKYLEKNNYRCRTPVWHQLLCHCPIYIDVDIPIIYIYDDPIKSFVSMKKRGAGIWDVNQKKLSNNLNTKLSDENLLKLMINQFNVWTSVKRNNVLTIKTNELFKQDIVNKLENFLKKKIFHFPIKYESPKTTNKDMEEFKLTNLYKKYKVEIDTINKYN